MVKTLWPELALKLPPRLLPRKVNMALKLRPTGFGSAIDKDRPDYTSYGVDRSTICRLENV